MSNSIELLFEAACQWYLEAALIYGGWSCQQWVHVSLSDPVSYVSYNLDILLLRNEILLNSFEQVS